MPRGAPSFVGILFMIIFAAFGSTSISRAEARARPATADSPYDLINAVNALRASYGLTPYSISSILMYTAQAQAEFLAATRSMSHSGPGGIGLTDRLLAAGYPLAGDLSLGGFRAENITGGEESKTAQAAVDGWTRDAPHLNTMVSPDLTEIGAGVAVSGGRVYYVIDCAQPIASGAPPVVATSLGGGSPSPAAAAVIIPVALSTPNADGNIFHEVKPGQTLWQIAIAYEVRIDEIKGLNNLLDNSIFPGDKLLIKTGVAVPTASPSEVSTETVTSMPTGAPASTVASPVIPTFTPMVVSASVSANNAMIMKVAMGSIALIVLVGGIISWLGGKKKV